MTLRFGDSRLHHWTMGAAGRPWIVISHGGGMDHQTFRPLALRLARHWRVLLWDMPGHGLSQPMPQPFSAELCAEALARVMDAAGAVSALHVGFSFGGVVAQLLAERAPERVNGMIAYGCFTPHLDGPALDAEHVDVLVESGFGRLAWPEIKATFAALCAERPDAQAAVQAALELVGRDGFLTMSKALLKAGRRAPEVRLPGPLLILYGSRDSNGAVLQEAMRTLQARHPHARTEVIADAGHCAHLDQPERFSAAVERFLSEFAAVGGEPPWPSHEEGATPDRFDASS